MLPSQTLALRALCPMSPDPLHIIMVKAGGCGGPRGWWRGRNAACTWTSPEAREGEWPPLAPCPCLRGCYRLSLAKRGEGTRGEWGTWLLCGGLVLLLCRPGLWSSGDEKQPQSRGSCPSWENFGGQKPPLSTKCGMCGVGEDVDILEPVISHGRKKTSQ